jgi:hypothetical protein
VAELGGGPHGAAIETAVEDQAAADARPQGEHDHVARPSARADAMLRHRGGVGVVLDRRRQTEATRKMCAEIEVVERDVHRRHRSALSLVDRRRDPNADRTDVVLHELADR